MPEGWWQAGAWLLNPPHAKNTKPDSVLSKSGGHVWGGGGLQSFERAGDGTHEEQPASLGSAGEMSMHDDTCREEVSADGKLGC